MVWYGSTVSGKSSGVAFQLLTASNFDVRFAPKSGHPL